jgi:hypothetical protein
MSLKVSHHYLSGFFSCCSILLHNLVNYFNINKSLPLDVNSSDMFHFYKNPDNINEDVTYDYFKKFNDKNNNFTFEYNSYVNYHHIHQYENYKNLDYRNLNNFIVKYFSPSQYIIDIINKIEEKYIKNIYYYDNICVLFYRGNDKVTETKLCEYSEFIIKAKEILSKNSNVVFLIQSDETEFIETMLKEFNNSFYFKDEIRHMTKRNSTTDIVFNNLNKEYSKYYLAITIIMAKCKYIICTSGNCSIWIMLFRMHANNVIQYLHDKWI